MSASAVRAPAGWWVLALLASVVGLLGIGDIIGGTAFEPDGPVALTGQTLDELRASSPEAVAVLDFRARMGGITLACFGVLLLVLAAVPYRAGRRWAWAALWLLPAWAVSFTIAPLVVGLAPGRSLSPAMLSGVVIAAIAAIALLAGRGRLRGLDA